MAHFWSYFTVTLLTIVGLLMIFIILLQRGRGGGLAGAFGGAGGSSALGTKAGDVFTKITVGLAVFWVVLACTTIYAMRAEADAPGLDVVSKSPAADAAALEAAPDAATPVVPVAPADPVAPVERRATGAGAIDQSSPKPAAKTPASTPKPVAKTPAVSDTAAPSETPAVPKAAKPAETVRGSDSAE